MSKINLKAISSPAPIHVEPGVIPCAVPYWHREQQAFLKLGGRYSDKRGFHVLESDYLPDFEEWLPRKWAYRGTPPQPVILPDMLPSSTWEDNLRTRLKPEEWDRLRKFCYSAAGNTCVACGSRGEPHVEAHEVWRFDEKTSTQYLKGLLCLCPTCHKIKHWGYSNRLGILPQVRDRIKWLNDWDDQILAKSLDDVAKRQDQLSRIKWTLDLSFLRTYGVR